MAWDRGSGGSGAGAERSGDMGQSARRFLVATLALCGILLVVLGIGGLRELLVVGKVPPDMLGRQVGFTVGSLAVGAVLIVWCLVAGLAWARAGRRGTGGTCNPRG